ncbi:hypothetical protein [Nocardia sp. NBC_01388]|uniref:hypothetical protein n=1 Tax=Nocardia sp. NBC_01388 TaxID=2903596 RepID=UPI0032484E4C
MTTKTAPASKTREFAHLTDEEFVAAIEGALRTEDYELFDRLVIEDQHRIRLAKARAARVARREAAYDKLIAAGTSREEATERAYGVRVETQRRRTAIAHLRAQGYTGRSFDELSRKAFRDHVYTEWLRAESATNGYLLSAAGERADMDPRDLWNGSEARATKMASEELRAWWDTNGRTSLAEYRAEFLSPSRANALRAARADFLR